LLATAAAFLSFAPAARAAQYTCECEASGATGCTSGTTKPSAPVTAASLDEAATKCHDVCNNTLGACLSSWSAVDTTPKLITGKNCPDGETCLTNPLDRCPDNTDPKAACHTLTVPALASNIISTAVGIVGALALLVFIYGGLRWLTSAGEPVKIQAGKDAMKWAAIGLVVIFSSYALVSFVFKAFTG